MLQYQSCLKKFHSTMILSSVFSLFATQVLGSIGRGFRQHGRLVAEYPWPIIVFRFENALKLPFCFFWTQAQSLQLPILFRKFPSIIGITVTSSHYCCLCSSPCLSLLVIIQRFVCNRLLRRDLTRVERGDRYVDPVAATGFHFCN